MCFGSKSKSTAAPPPGPATVFKTAPADTSNTDQRAQVNAASTATQSTDPATLGSELGG